MCGNQKCEYYFGIINKHGQYVKYMLKNKRRAQKHLLAYVRNKMVSHAHNTFNSWKKIAWFFLDLTLVLADHFEIL